MRVFVGPPPKKKRKKRFFRLQLPVQHPLNIFSCHFREVEALVLTSLFFLPFHPCSKTDPLVSSAGVSRGALWRLFACQECPCRRLHTIVLTTVSMGASPRVWQRLFQAYESVPPRVPLQSWQKICTRIVTVCFPLLPFTVWDPFPEQCPVFLLSFPCIHSFKCML